FYLRFLSNRVEQEIYGNVEREKCRQQRKRTLSERKDVNIYQKEKKYIRRSRHVILCESLYAVHTIDSISVRGEFVSLGIDWMKQGWRKSSLSIEINNPDGHYLLHYHMTRKKANEKTLDDSNIKSNYRLRKGKEALEKHSLLNILIHSPVTLV
ncbi:hypothetical protein ALC53_02920, partial [Atta colombica]